MKVSYNNLEPVEWSGDDVLLCEAGFDVREMISRCKGLSMSCHGFFNVVPRFLKGNPTLKTAQFRQDLG